MQVLVGNNNENLCACTSFQQLDVTHFVYYADEGYNKYMTNEVTIAVISGIVAIVVAAISKTELFSRKHYSMRKDVELYKSLPDESAKKDDLMKYIDRRIGEYITKATQHKRSGTEIAIGIIFLPIGGYLSWFFYSLGSWWLAGLLVSGFMLIIGAYGVINGLRKVERDEKGNAVTKK